MKYVSKLAGMLVAAVLFIPAGAVAQQNGANGMDNYKLIRTELGIGLVHPLNKPQLSNGEVFKRGGKFGFKVQAAADVFQNDEKNQQFFAGVQAFGSWSPNEEIQNSVSSSSIDGEHHTWGIGVVGGTNVEITEDANFRAYAGAGAAYVKSLAEFNGSVLYEGDAIVPTVFGGIGLFCDLTDYLEIGATADFYWKGGYDVQNPGGQSFDLGGNVDLVAGITLGYKFPYAE